MAHDGQEMPLNPDQSLDRLLPLTAAALVPVDKILATAKTKVRALVSENGRIDAALVEEHQTAAHGFAWLATYADSLRQMQKWAEKLSAEGKFGETEQLIHQIAFGEYLAQINGGIPMNQGEVVRPADMGLTWEDVQSFLTGEVMALIRDGNTQAARTRLVALMQEHVANITVGASGLDEELEMIREQFRRYALEKVEPLCP